MADKPNRRWFQFRLRTLLVSDVLLSVPCGYLAGEARFVAARKAWMDEHDPRISGDEFYWTDFDIPQPPRFLLKCRHGRESV